MVYVEKTPDYDDAGNITALTFDDGTGGVATNYTFDGDLMTAIDGNPLEWDLNGGMVQGTGPVIEYNWDNMLRSAELPYDPNVFVRYDPTGSRIDKEITDGITSTKRKYIIDPAGDLSQILLEINPADDTIVKTYMYANDQIVAQYDGSGVDPADSKYFYLHDRLGSVRLVLGEDGDVKNRYTYQPFGELFAAETNETVDNPFKYTGQYHDAEIGQYYLRARQYEPYLNRFISRDPVRGEYKEPLTLHRYLYALNDPIDRIDPAGELSFGSVMTGVGWGLRAYGAYSAATGILGRVRQFVHGASLRNVVMGAVIDVSLNLGVGKAFGFLAKFGGKLINAAGRKASNIWKRGAGRKRNFTQGQLTHFMGIYERDGINSLLKSRRTIARNLKEHKDKLPRMRYKSAVEQQIRRMESELDAIDEILEATQ